MKPRLAPILVSLPLTAALLACSAGAPVTTSPGAKGAPTLPAAAAPASAAPVAATPSSAPIAAASPAPAASPDEGNVDGPATPDLSIVPVGAEAIRVTLADTAAKAWRIIVAGTGSRAGDRWTLEVETGDVAPAITTVDTRAGVDGDPQEQVALEMGDTAGRLCSAVVPVCVAARSLQLPAGGNGTLVLELARTDASAPLAVTAATAPWIGEPFNLGPWTTTEAFPWEA
jgi:hypothetical protein